MPVAEVRRSPPAGKKGMQLSGEIGFVFLGHYDQHGLEYREVTGKQRNVTRAWRFWE